MAYFYDMNPGYSGWNFVWSSKLLNLMPRLLPPGEPLKQNHNTKFPLCVDCKIQCKNSRYESLLGQRVKCLPPTRIWLWWFVFKLLRVNKWLTPADLLKASVQYYCFKIKQCGSVCTCVCKLITRNASLQPRPPSSSRVNGVLLSQAAG